MSAKDKSASASRHGLTSGTAAAHSSVAQTLEASTQNDGQKEERKEDAEQLTAGKKPMATPDDTEAVGFVKSGSNVFKLRSGRRSHTRNVYVDEDGVTLHYKHPNKSKYFTWSGGHRKIPLEQVTEVLDDAEPDASVRRKKKSQNQDSTSRSSIVVGNKRKTLDFAPQSEKEKELWIRGLTTQVKSYRSAGFDEHQTMWLSQKFEEADVNGDESLDLKEIVKLMQSLSFCPLATEHVGELCKAQKLNKARFIELYKKLCRRAEIDNIFTKYATNCDYLSPDDLVKFFGQEQNEKLELTDAENLIQSAERCPEFKNRSLLSAAGFQDLFASERMNIMKPLCRKVYQDMTQPLSHYYINSSHNTYLEGNQLYGVSSVPQYERVLTHSCRCVELDVWDGSDGEPIVHHGYTLTSKVPFLDVLLGIKKSAFKNSDYPVILSLENHCSVEQQRIMAKYLHDTFGSSLVTESLEEGRDRLPSPEELRRKVIVECKKLPAVITDDDDSLSEEDEAAEMADEEVQQQVRKRAETEQRYQLATELSDCVTLQSSKFGSFEAAAAKRTFAFMTSFKENKALKLSESETVEFVRNNARLLSRIYPAGIRIGSCNFHPMPMWNVGCQLLAMNFQNRDEPLLLNYGRFQDNGGCGYVLKPKFLRTSDSTFKTNGPFPADDSRTLEVRIISGFVLPKKSSDSTSSILDPYVQVDVFGVPSDCTTHATQIIRNNGFHPLWNELLPPYKILCPDLAILLFRVFDKDGIMIAQKCFPFNCIQSGYRMVALRDKDGSVIGATSLFVHIAIS